MELISHYGEARYGSAVALSELKHVENEPITDFAAECARKALDGSLEHIKTIN